jgi:hypothetical protein
MINSSDDHVSSVQESAASEIRDSIEEVSTHHIQHEEKRESTQRPESFATHYISPKFETRYNVVLTTPLNQRSLILFVLWDEIVTGTRGGNDYVA